jgi:hypothetical protein
MLYMVAFTTNVPQMLPYIAYMDPMVLWDWLAVLRSVSLLGAAIDAAEHIDAVEWHDAILHQLEEPGPIGGGPRSARVY